MYIKVFPHGKGRGEKAVQYLVNTTYANRKDNPPKVLRGDPDMTTELINCLPFAWKYTSGVLSWSSEDKVSDGDEEKLMDDFENVAFAGLDKGQYSMLWVRHKHANHHELHFIIPRVELTQGKSFNAFSPGWQKDFDVLRDYYNIKHNWARPDDPKRQRICVPSNASLLHNKLKRFGVEIKKTDKDKAQEMLVEYAKNAIQSGTVTNREELINAYKELGLTINRTGKNYITIKNGEQKIRLKGGIFDESWRIGAKDTGKANSRETNAGTGNYSELGKLQGKLEQIIAKRSDYNRKRYKSIRNEEQGAHQIEYEKLLHIFDRIFSSSLFDNSRKPPGNILSGEQHLQAGGANTATRGRSIQGTANIKYHENNEDNVAKRKWQKLYRYSRKLILRNRLESWQQPRHKDTRLNDRNTKLSYQNRTGNEQAKSRSLAGTGNENSRIGEQSSRITEQLGNLESALSKLDRTCQQIIFYLQQPAKLLSKPKEIMQSRTQTIKKFFGLSR